MNGKVVYAVIILLFCAACKISNEEVSTPTQISEAATAVTPFVTAVIIAPSASPSYTPLPTSAAANTETSPTSTVTATPPSNPTQLLPPTPQFSMLFPIRQPTVEQLNDFLGERASEDFPFYRELNDFAELFYEDVNGDGEDDLIVSDYLTVIVFLWSGEYYFEPFFLQARLFKYDPSSRVMLQDWTNDGIPEVIFDHNRDTGGTGIQFDAWHRYIIHCLQSKCNIAWHNDLDGLVQDNNGGGVGIVRGTVRLSLNPNNVPVIRYISNSFGFYTSGEYLPISYEHNGPRYLPTGYSVRSLNVFTSTLTLYEWNESEFIQTDKQIISLPHVIHNAATLSASSENGDVAIITPAIADINRPPLNDVCELTLNGRTIDEPFGCKANFTIVEWRDITGDDQDELIVTTASGIHGSGEESWDWQRLTDLNCAHQRIMAFIIDGENVTNIADVSGCIVQEDLFGVKLQDYDNDGQLEILAADSWFTKPSCPPNIEPILGSYTCWHEFGHNIQIYEWNDSRFTFWDDIPAG